MTNRALIWKSNYPKHIKNKIGEARFPYFTLNVSSHTDEYGTRIVEDYFFHYIKNINGYSYENFVKGDFSGRWKIISFKKNTFELYFEVNLEFRKPKNFFHWLLKIDPKSHNETFWVNFDEFHFDQEVEYIPKEYINICGQK